MAKEVKGQVEKVTKSKLLEEFKAFAFKGNVVDMAVGVIIGGAFGKIVTSVVNDLFMPLLSLLTGGLDTSALFLQLDFFKADRVIYDTAAAANEAGISTLNYGAFLQNVIDFLLVAVCIFAMIKMLAKMHKKEEPAPAPAKAPNLCPFCKTEIPEGATRCPHCTSELK